MFGRDGEWRLTHEIKPPRGFLAAPIVKELSESDPRVPALRDETNRLGGGLGPVLTRLLLHRIGPQSGIARGQSRSARECSVSRWPALRQRRQGRGGPGAPASLEYPLGDPRLPSLQKCMMDPVYTPADPDIPTRALHLV